MNGIWFKERGLFDNDDDTWLGLDNVNGKWYIAYHGIGFRFSKKILETGFNIVKVNILNTEKI